MQKRSERTLFLFACLIAFSCVLISGAWRLFDRETAQPDQGRPVSAVSAVLRCAPASQAEEPIASEQTQRMGNRRPIACLASGLTPARSVCCDANGNVLSALSYLRTVYQLFALSDGFA